MGVLATAPAKPDLLGMLSYDGVPACGVLEYAASVIPDRTAIVSDHRSWSFLSLQRDCAAAAAMLQKLGVTQGDRVGILLPNLPEYIIAANAIWKAGGVVVSISPLLVAEEVDQLIDQTECRWVISLDVLSHLVRNDDVQLILVSLREHLPTLSQLGYLWMRRHRTGTWRLPPDDRRCWFWESLAQTDHSWIPVPIDSESDPALIQPTGGTTGTPRAVTLSHRNLVANAWQQYSWTQRSFARETMLAVLPFFHSYGMSATVMSGMMMGATQIMHHRFNTRKTISLIERYRPTVFHAVPAMLDAMNERFRQYPLREQPLRWVISGGAALDESIGREFSKHTGAVVVQGYGLSEASPVTHVGDLFYGRDCTSIGYPLPETASRIDSPSAEGIGELLVKGPQVMLGYWNDPEATHEVLIDGWLHTGDLAKQESDGTFRIVGRKKDLIITSGFNVFPSEVEEVLNGVPRVLESAVVGDSDPRRGEVVKAFVVLQPGAPWNEEELATHCRQHLAKYKRPRQFQQHHGPLPRNFLGKLMRRKLRSSS